MCRRLSLVWGTVLLAAACSNGPRQRTRPQPASRARSAAKARAASVAPAGPLAAPLVYRDGKRVAALRAQLAKTSDAPTALALGRLLHLAGKRRAAEQAFGRARAVLHGQGAVLRPAVVTGSGLGGFQWHGDTLAFIRSLYPATRDYRGGWAQVELWDRIGGRFVAPRLRVGPPRAGGGLAWRSADRLWVHGGHRLLELDSRTGQVVRRLPTGQVAQPRHRGFARWVAVASGTGHLAATVGSQTVRVWSPGGNRVRDVTVTGTTSHMIRANMGSHCEMRSVSSPVTVAALALSPRGRFVAVAGTDGKIRLVRVKTGRKRTLQQKWRRMFYAFPRNPFSRRRPLKLWFTAAGKALSLLQADSRLFRWDATTGKLKHQFQVSCKPPPPRPGPKPSGLITPRLRRRWARQRCVNVRGADLTADGKLLATVRGKVRLWRMPGGARLADPPVKRAQSVRFDPRGKAYAVSSWYRGGAVWQVSTARRVGDLGRTQVQGQIVDITANGRYLAIWEAAESYSKLKRVVVWDLARRKRLGQLTVWGLEAARFTSDGRAFVAGVGDGVEQWQLAPWRRQRRFAGPKLAQYGRQLTTAGDHLVVWGYADKKWRVWTRSSGKVRAFDSAGRVEQLVLSPDGARLALATKRQLALWAVAAGRRLRTLAEPDVVSMAWSHDGRHLAVAQRRGQAMRVLDAASGAERARLKHKHYSSLALLFGPTGRQLYVGGIGVFGRWDWQRSTALVSWKMKYRHLSPRALKLGVGGRRLLTFGFRYREVSVWDPATGRLFADLWPVEGAHWVAQSRTGAVDATVRGRQTLVTLVPPRTPPSSQPGRTRADAVYGWELGWACFVRPGLVPAAVQGKPVAPPKRVSCRIAP